MHQHLGLFGLRRRSRFDRGHGRLHLLLSTTDIRQTGFSLESNLVRFLCSTEKSTQSGRCQLTWFIENLVYTSSPR